MEEISDLRFAIAYAVAAVADIVDYFGGFAPWLGEGADLVPPIVIAGILKWHPYAFAGMIEVVSAIGLWPVDFIPTNLIAVYMAHKKIKKEMVAFRRH